MGEYEAKTPYERHLIDQLAAANARADGLESALNLACKSSEQTQRELEEALAAARRECGGLTEKLRESQYDYMRLREASSIETTEAAKWITLRDKQAARAQRAERIVEELHEVLHDAALFLDSADWHLGVARHRTPWDDELRALVVKLRALDNAALAAPGDGEEGTQ